MQTMLKNVEILLIYFQVYLHPYTMFNIKKTPVQTIVALSSTTVDGKFKQKLIHWIYNINKPNVNVTNKVTTSNNAIYWLGWTGRKIIKR